jgi:hypothetical protein
MEEFVDKLLYNFGSSKRYPLLEQRIKTRKRNFKKILTKNQYRQLHRMLDDAENIEGETALDNFKCGLRFGVQLMAEVYSNANNELEY